MTDFNKVMNAFGGVCNAVSESANGLVERQMQMTQDMVENANQAFSKLSAVKDGQEFMGVQSELAQQNAQQAVNNTRELVDMSKDAQEKITAKVQVAMSEVEKSAKA